MPDKNGFEADLFGVLDDLSGYLADLTLVGGWVPHIYARFLWRADGATPVFTSDVDLGLAPEQALDYTAVAEGIYTIWRVGLAFLIYV